MGRLIGLGFRLFTSDDNLVSTSFVVHSRTHRPQGDCEIRSFVCLKQP